MASSVVWVDIPVRDLERARRFYAAMLGSEVPRHGDIAVLPHEDGVGGCLITTAGDEPAASGALIYLNCQGRLDSAIAMVAANGGKVLQPKHSIAPHGWRCVVLDSEGNRVALHSM